MFVPHVRISGGLGRAISLVDTMFPVRNIPSARSCARREQRFGTVVGHRAQSSGGNQCFSSFSSAVKRSPSQLKQLRECRNILPRQVVSHDDLPTLLVQAFDSSAIQAIDALGQSHSTPDGTVQAVNGKGHPRRVVGWLPESITIGERGRNGRKAQHADHGQAAHSGKVFGTGTRFWGTKSCWVTPRLAATP